MAASSKVSIAVRSNEICTGISIEDSTRNVKRNSITELVRKGENFDGKFEAMKHVIENEAEALRTSKITYSSWQCKNKKNNNKT